MTITDVSAAEPKDVTPTEGSNKAPTSGGVKTALDTKVSGSGDVGTDTKPIKIVNGVATAVANDLVDTATAQEINGDKKFTSSVTLEKGYNPFYVVKDTTENYQATPSSNEYMGIGFQDKNAVTIGSLTTAHYTNGNRKTYIEAKGEDGTMGAVEMYIMPNGTKYVTAPARAYNANNTMDVVTIALLQASTDVVHTSGNETIGGTKTFSTCPVFLGGHDTTTVILRNSRFNGNNYSANQSEGFILLTNGESTPKAVVGLGVKQFGDPWNRLLNVTIHNNDGSSYKQYNLIDYNGYVYATTPSAGDSSTKVATTAFVGTALGDYVTLGTAQNISGEKTFYNTGFCDVRIKSNRTGDNLGGISFFNGDNVRLGQVYGSELSSKGSVVINARFKDTDSRSYFFNDGTNGWIQASTRPYNASYIEDVVTIGSLQASTDVLHTAGNENFSGTKTANDQIIGITNGKLMATVSGTGGKWKKILSFKPRDHCWAHFNAVQTSGGRWKLIDFWFDAVSGGNMTVYKVFSHENTSYTNTAMIFTFDSDNSVQVWMKIPAGSISARLFMDKYYGNTGPSSSPFTDTGDTTEYDEPQSADYAQLIKVE